ncbi:MAG: SDR family oxidoreductase [Gammaproteobacteria bacterium]|jgi:short-subunit dehydrogenase
MQLNNVRVLLTGAAGGIGSEIATLLAGRGARVALLDRNLDALNAFVGQSVQGDCFIPIAVDLLNATERQQAVHAALNELGGLDLLINNAGLMSFRPFAEEDPAVLERLMQLNTITPMLITRQLLPILIEQGSGRIVNIGSTFGSIGFAWFSAYSASKFALRGFSEALRRELDGTGVGLTYVAPRAVKTRLNSGAIYRMAEAVKMNMDEPEWVARRIVDAIEQDAGERYLGFPESLFTRINALLPGVVDGALRKQNLQMQPFARGEN